MTLDLTNPLDRLYLEYLPTRPSPVDASLRWQGPTAAFADLEIQRGLWALAAVAGDERPAA